MIDQANIKPQKSYFKNKNIFKIFQTFLIFRPNAIEWKK